MKMDKLTLIRKNIPKTILNSFLVNFALDTCLKFLDHLCVHINPGRRAEMQLEGIHSRAKAVDHLVLNPQDSFGLQQKSKSETPPLTVREAPTATLKSNSYLSNLLVWITYYVKMKSSISRRFNLCSKGHKNRS